MRKCSLESRTNTYVYMYMYANNQFSPCCSRQPWITYRHVCVCLHVYKRTLGVNVCMYVCMCLYIRCKESPESHANVYVCMYVCMCLYIYTCVKCKKNLRTRMHTYIHTHIHACIHTHTHIHAWIHTYTHIHACVYVTQKYLCVNIHTYAQSF